MSDTNTTPPLDKTEAMTPRDWFILFLRILGTWKLLSTVDFIVTIFDIRSGIWRSEHTPVESYVTHALASFVIGLWLLKAAPTIAGIFYRSKPGNPVPEAKSLTTAD